MEIYLMLWLLCAKPEALPPREPFVLILEIKVDKKKIIYHMNDNN